MQKLQKFWVCLEILGVSVGNCTESAESRIMRPNQSFRFARQKSTSFKIIVHIVFVFAVNGTFPKHLERRPMLLYVNS